MNDNLTVTKQHQPLDNPNIYQELGAAFLARKAKGLYDLIVKQGDMLLQKCGSITPSNCVSIVLMLNDAKSLTSSQIANSLNTSHQLISQRLERLEKLGLINRVKNSEDKRARYVCLSDLGTTEMPKIKKACEIAENCFQDIYKQINIDLGAAIDKMKDKLEQQPLEC